MILFLVQADDNYIWNANYPTWWWSGLEIDLEFPAMDMLLWQVKQITNMNLVKHLR